MNVSRKHVNGSTKSIRSSRSRVKAKAKTKAMGPIHVALRYCNPLMNIMTEMRHMCIRMTLSRMAFSISSDDYCTHKRSGSDSS